MHSMGLFPAVTLSVFKRLPQWFMSIIQPDIRLWRSRQIIYEHG